MAEFKLVLSDPKTGKSVQREVKDDTAKKLIGLKIKDVFKGELIDLPGYEFVITGGSDSSGFPMRWDVSGSAKKKITGVKSLGIGNKIKKPNPRKKGWRKMEGMRLKKTVAGNTIHAKTAQINLKVTKKGKEPLFGEEKAEEKPAKEDLGKQKKSSKIQDVEKAQERFEKDEEDISRDDEEIKKTEEELNKA